jgi:hypothetical protein
LGVGGRSEQPHENEKKSRAETPDDRRDEPLQASAPRKLFRRHADDQLLRRLFLEGERSDGGGRAAGVSAFVTAPEECFHVFAQVAHFRSPMSPSANDRAAMSGDVSAEQPIVPAPSRRTATDAMRLII